MNDDEVYDWDWRETPEWREVERAVSNLINMDPEEGASMLTDFVIVTASVPETTRTELLGLTNIFCSSKHGYVTKGLLTEGMDIQGLIEEGS